MSQSAGGVKAVTVTEWSVWIWMYGLFAAYDPIFLITHLPES
jgi:hypothetical protein